MAQLQASQPGPRKWMATRPEAVTGVGASGRAPAQEGEAGAETSTTSARALGSTTAAATASATFGDTSARHGATPRARARQARRGRERVMAISGCC